MTPLLPGIGSIIGGIGSIWGGIQGQDNQSQQFWQNVKMSNRNLRFQKKQWRYQKQFNEWMARQGLIRNTMSWRMKDAKRAGIHPIYALGATPGYSPTISMGGPSGGSQLPGYSGDGGFASGIAQAGQHLGRAVDAMATHEQRAEARVVAALSVERAGLENELLRSQIRRMDAGTGPAMPGGKSTYLIDGQGNAVNITPSAIAQNAMLQKLPEPGQNIKFGSTWQANPHISNAEDIETRYGEIADALWGAAAIPADVYWNVSRSKVGQKIWSMLGYDNFNDRFHFGRR